MKATWLCIVAVLVSMASSGCGSAADQAAGAAAPSSAPGEDSPRGLDRIERLPRR